MIDELDVEWLNDRSEFQQNFVHGLRNRSGLQLQFELDGERIVTVWTADERHVGYPGFVHGGLVRRCSTTPWGGGPRCTGAFS